LVGLNKQSFWRCRNIFLEKLAQPYLEKVARTTEENRSNQNSKKKKKKNRIQLLLRFILTSTFFCICCWNNNVHSLMLNQR